MRLRTAMLSALICCCIALLSSSHALALSGTVFVDANSNGYFDAGEDVLEGVRVSDGAAIAVTADDGSYRLPDPNGRAVVYVTQPTGYSAEPWWHAVAPDDDGSMDFALRPEEQMDGFHFVHVTDVHIKPDVVEHVRAFVRRVNDMQPVPGFVANTGDLVWDLLEAESEADVTDAFGLHVEAYEGLELRQYCVPGNHDHAGYAGELSPDSPLYATGGYERYFGPPWYSFEHGGYLFVALDATVGVTEGDDRPRWGYTDTLRPDCLEWLRNELAHVQADQPVIVLIHEPVHGLTNRETLETVLADHNVIAVLSGHYHTTAHYNALGTTEYVGGALCGSWWEPGPSPDGAPRGYNIVRCIDGQVEVFYQAAVGRHHMTMLEPGGEQPMEGAIRIRARVWDPEGAVHAVRAELGGTRTELEIDDGVLWREITGVVETDELADGDYALRVIARDIGGREWFAGRDVQLLRDHHSLLRGAEDATLLLSVYHEAGPVKVLVNGRPVGEVPGEGGFHEPAEVTVPGHVLRHANRVRLVSGTDRDMWAHRLRLEHGGDIHHEPRTRDNAVRLNGRNSPHEMVIFLGRPCMR